MITIEEQQLRTNIVSLYQGNESEIGELSRAFGISEAQVRGYIDEENTLYKERTGSYLWEPKIKNTR